jgi:hypothetical protein
MLFISLPFSFHAFVITIPLMKSNAITPIQVQRNTPKEKSQQHPHTLMLFAHSSSSMHQSNIPCPLLALRNPLVYHGAISNPQSHLERLAIHRKPIRHLITTEAVQNRLVTGFLRRQDFKGDDAAQEGRVQLAVGKVGADAPDEIWG